MSTPFPIGAVHGANVPPLLSFVLLAEFDVKSGSTLRHVLPSKIPGVEDDWFAEHMLPDGAHMREQDFTVFFLRRENEGFQEHWDRSGGDEDMPAEPLLYCLNIFKTVRDETADRGAVLKSLAICSPYHFVCNLRSSVEEALAAYYEDPRLEVLQAFYDKMNCVDLSAVPRPTVAERALMHRSVGLVASGAMPEMYHTDQWAITLDAATTASSEAAAQSVDAESEGGGPSDLAPLTLRLFEGPDEILAAPLTSIVKTFGDATMKIFNAILMGRRVLFIGYNIAAGDVCRYALAAANFVAPPFLGTVRRRVYPYVTLADLCFLEAPGYIAGATNPVFETNESWWDLLCEISTEPGKGKVVTADERREEKERARGEQRERERERDPPHTALDKAFLARIAAGCDTYGDVWVRKMFWTYLYDIINVALDVEDPSSATPQKVSPNHFRAEELRKSPEWKEERQRFLDPWHADESMEHELVVLNGSGPDDAGISISANGRMLRSGIQSLLQGSSSRNSTDIERSYALLVEQLQSETALQTFLMLVPESKGGLHLISAGLFSPSEHVRSSTVALLKRMEEFQSTKPAVRALNHFMNLSFTRALVREGQKKGDLTEDT